MADRLFIPSRSEVWLADFDHLKLDAENRLVHDERGLPVYTRHREHGGTRPCLVLSSDEFNEGTSQLVIVAPITKELKRISTHVPIDPPEGGLRVPSFMICEGIRSISRQFLIRKWGHVEGATMREVESALKKLLRFQD